MKKSGIRRPCELTTESRSADAGAQRTGLALAGGPLSGGACRVELSQLQLQGATLWVGGIRIRLAAVPGSLAVQVPRALVVGEGAFERVEQLCAQALGLDRHRQLDAVVEVARHQVRGGDVDRLLAAAFEGVDARVLEQPADDRDDPDVL